MLKPGILIPLFKWVPDIAKQTFWWVTTMRLGFLRALSLLLKEMVVCDKAIIKRTGLSFELLSKHF